MAQFTKRHYETIARELQDVHADALVIDDGHRIERLAMVALVRDRLAQRFALDNPRFDHTRFINASLAKCIGCGNPVREATICNDCI